ncbi:hypothetical protein [Bacillus sp. FJAT-52991]|uniref:Uncharacterized protein n=1 Tax=Bacillus kandeliae TaxID=3129297 RepID=A0ABZ2N2L8_9BACI
MGSLLSGLVFIIILSLIKKDKKFFYTGLKILAPGIMFFVSQYLLSFFGLEMKIIVLISILMFILTAVVLLIRERIKKIPNKYNNCQ